jgi:hypothetical protein
MNQLNVPWDKIKESVEAGMPITKVANLFSIKADTIKQRSLREKWSTPRRRAAALKEEMVKQDSRVAGRQTLKEELMIAEAGQKSPATSGVVDFEQFAKDYRSKGVLKMARLLDTATLAPPRNYKDLDIADKIMRRLLGLDDGESKANTIVQLQVVNDRLKATLDADIVEGELVAESVPKVSQADDDQREMTGCIPVGPSILTSAPLPSDKDAGCQD